MNSLKSNIAVASHFHRNKRGFALIVTLSLLMLLTVIAVGLLTLASISLRASAQAESSAIARANARLALMLAIGDLQVELGPDRRINCQAGIDKGALPENRNWLASYDAWNANAMDRPDALKQFRRYLVSGDRATLQKRDTAKAAIPGQSIELVSTGTLGAGTTDGRVKAGLVPLTSPGGKSLGQCAWWIGDDNAKAMVNAGRDIPTTVSDELLAQHTAQSASGTGFALIDSLAGVNVAGRQSWEMGDNLRFKALSLPTAKFIPGVSGNLGAYFHDITTRSSGLLTDVRNGQLKRDLSLYLEQDYAPSARGRLRQPLYTVQSAATVNFSPDSTNSALWDKLDEFSGITMEELWLYYNLYKQVSYNRPSSSDAKVGIIPAGYPTLVSANTRDDVIRDPFFVYKRQVYSQVKYILSLAAGPNATQPGKFDVRLSVDPVIVLWNPNNVALEYQVGGYTSVSFSTLPYSCKFDWKTTTGSTTITVPFINFFNNVNGISAQVGKVQKIILRPGESRVLSPAADATGTAKINVDVQSGWDFNTGAVFSSSSFPTALSASDTVKVTLQPTALRADGYITYWFGSRSPDPAYQQGTIIPLNGIDTSKEFPVVTSPTYSVSNILTEKKMPLMLFSYYLRPELDTLRRR